MKKGKVVIVGLVMFIGLTGIVLYKKQQKAETKAEQEALDREAGQRILKKQKEERMESIRAEEKRSNDSIARTQRNEMNKGLQMLKEAKENLE